MARGRPRKPSKVKEFEGNPGHRPIAPEPQPEPTPPTCPAHLDAAAKAEWRRMVKLLEPLGLITQVDRAALAVYCQLWSRWVEAEKAIRDEGAVVESPNGHPCQSPWISIANTALKNLKSFLVEFGLTPGSRSRVSSFSPAEPESALKLFFTEHDEERSAEQCQEPRASNR